jgi:tetratricopeptide (TPR) repeat protein
MPDITRELQRLQHRILRQAFVGRLVTCGLIAAGLYLVVACVRFFQGVPPWTTSGFVILLVAAPCAAAVWAWIRRPTLERTAAWIDDAAGTRDRFLTRYRLADEKSPTDLQRLAAAECDAFIGRFDGARHTRARVPAQALWMVAPLIAALLLQWQYRIANRPTADSLAAQAELQQKADEIEQLRKQVKEVAEKLQSEELDRIAEEMKRSAESLRSERDRGARAEAKTALRELSALEAMVAAMQEQSEASATEEMEALAEALAETEETKDAAEALKKGDLAKAAEELEKALEELERRGEEETDEELAELARAMQEALQELSEAQRQQIAEQMRKMAQSQGDSEASREALRRLAEMMKQMAKNSGRPQNTGDAKQAMKNLLQALQNMKFGDPQQGQTAQGNPKPGENPSGTMTLSFGQPPTGEGMEIPLPGLPSGEPGSDNDTGTSDSPFGGRQSPIADEGTASQLGGTLGEGESLSDLVPATGDQTKSTRRYRELYEAMAPAAEDAVLQENIPLGSRFYIRRYFESIRPKE